MKILRCFWWCAEIHSVRPLVRLTPEVITRIAKTNTRDFLKLHDENILT